MAFPRHEERLAIRRDLRSDAITQNRTQHSARLRITAGHGIIPDKVLAVSGFDPDAFSYNRQFVEQSHRFSTGKRKAP